MKDWYCYSLNYENWKRTLSSPDWLSYALSMSSYKGDKNFSGLGTDVMVLVAPLIS